MRKPNKKKSKLLENLRIIKNAFFAVILVILVGILILTLFSRISGRAPSFFGYSIYRVSTGSMEPTLEIGEVILSREWDPMELAEGDIVSYQGTSGEFAGKIVTHRVEKPPYEYQGRYYIVTKGDKNPSPDTPIEIEQILGRYERKLPIITWLYNFFVTPWGLLSIFALIILAFFNEIIILVRTIFHMDTVEAANEDIDNLIDRYRKEAEEKAKAEEAAKPSEGEKFSELFDEIESKNENI